MKTQLIYLTGILIIVWLSIISVIFIIANFITKFTFPLSGWIGSFLTNIFRTILGAVVGLIWLYGWKKLYIFYFKWSLRKIKK